MIGPPFCSKIESNVPESAIETTELFLFFFFEFQFPSENTQKRRNCKSFLFQELKGKGVEGAEIEAAKKA